MKLLIRSFGAEHFQTHARGVARAIARQMSKILKFYQFVMAKSGQNSKILIIWRAKTRATLSECV